MTSTDSEEWLLTCLSRWLLYTYDLNGRRAFLQRWRQTHGKESEAKVKAALEREWHAIRARA